jgi:hypothetical protein
MQSGVILTHMMALVTYSQEIHCGRQQRCKARMAIGGTLDLPRHSTANGGSAEACTRPKMPVLAADVALTPAGSLAAHCGVSSAVTTSAPPVTAESSSPQPQAVAVQIKRVPVSQGPGKDGDTVMGGEGGMGSCADPQPASDGGALEGKRVENQRGWDEQGCLNDLDDSAHAAAEKAATKRFQWAGRIWAVWDSVKEDSRVGFRQATCHMPLLACLLAGTSLCHSMFKASGAEETRVTEDPRRQPHSRKFALRFAWPCKTRQVTKCLGTGTRCS